MIKLKKYANGQFFDTINKKYVKVASLEKMIINGEKIKVTLTKTGKDITDSVIKQLSKKETPKTDKNKKTNKKKTDKKKKTPFLNTKSLKKWAAKVIDKRIVQVLDTIKLPNRKQIEQLDANIKALNKKIDSLEKLQKAKTVKAKTTKTKTAKTKTVKKDAAPKAKETKSQKTATPKTDSDVK